MPEINLLPWRAKKRKAQENDFCTGVLLAVMLTIFCCILRHLSLSQQITREKNSQQFYQLELQRLAPTLQTAQALKKKKKELMERIEIAKKIVWAQPGFVQILNELPRLIPSGIALIQLQQQGHEWRFRGHAISNTLVYTFMEHLTVSSILQDPRLMEIKASLDQTFYFEIKVGIRAIHPSGVQVHD